MSWFGEAVGDVRLWRGMGVGSGVCGRHDETGSRAPRRRSASPSARQSPRTLTRMLSVVVLVLLGALGAPSAAPAAMDWNADAESPWTSEWASYSCQSSSRFSRVASPRAQRVRAYRLEVRDGDNSWGERCELGQGNPRKAGFPLFEQGEERWISYQVYLSHTFPIATTRWNVIHQLKQLGSMGTPALSMEVRDGRFYLMNSSTNGVSCCTRSKWVGRAVRNRWIKFSLRVRFSPYPRVGFVELYGDLDGRGRRLLMPRIYTHTMKRDSSGRGVPSHSRIGIYRDPAISGRAQLYFDGYTVARDRAEAERRAFGA